MEGAAEAVSPQRLQELDAAGRENSSTEPQSLVGARLVICRQEVETSILLPSTLSKLVPLPQLPIQMNRTDFYGRARW